MSAVSAALKTGLVVFWATWLSIVFLTNLFAGLKAFRVLPQEWKFASENWRLIQNATQIYAVPGWVSGLLFAGVILWQGIAVGFFWIAVATGQTAGRGGLLALAINLGLWAGFMIADEIFQRYEQQSSHLEIFLAQLISALAVALLP